MFISFRFVFLLATNALSPPLAKLSVSIPQNRTWELQLQPNFHFANSWIDHLAKKSHTFVKCHLAVSTEVLGIARSSWKGFLFQLLVSRYRSPFFRFLEFTEVHGLSEKATKWAIQLDFGRGTQSWIRLVLLSDFEREFRAS